MNDEEEAYFYFTLNDFQELVKTHGFGFVFSKLSKEAQDTLDEYFYNTGL